MACSGSSSSKAPRAAVLAWTLAGAPFGALAAQSSHLTLLERSAPASAVEPVSVVAGDGWLAAWLAPAAGGRSTGLLAGIEHNGFAALTTVLVAARFHAGPSWQISFAQTSVKDLFDPALVEQYPGLAALGASATQVAADAVKRLGPAFLSVGARYERDELLGDATTAWLARASAATPFVLGVRAAVVVEHPLNGTTVSAGATRLTAGLARSFTVGRVGLDWGAGASLGDVWALGRARRLLATSLRLSLLDLVSLSAGVGTERDPFGSGDWLGYAAFGLGVRVGGFGADLRRGGPADALASPMAVSLLWEPRPRP
ncbi:MAG TPA: hypothetical protein VGA37_02775 [Gemmatimonadales bacterium]